MSLKSRSPKSLAKSCLLTLSIISTSLAYSVTSHATTTIVDAESTQYLADLKLRAQNGDADAQMELGINYLSGYELTQSLDDAIYWLTQAAETNPEAQWLLGRLHLGYDGMAIDYKKAFMYFEKSANAGYAKGQFEVAKLYREGKGVTQDYDKALKLYRLSAEQGYPLAINNIGDMYETGHGVPQDFVKARAYYLESIAKGEPFGYASMGQLYELGRGVEQNLNTAKDLYQQSCDRDLKLGCDAVLRLEQTQE